MDNLRNLRDKISRLEESHIGDILSGLIDIIDEQADVIQALRSDIARLEETVDQNTANIGWIDTHLNRL